MMSLKNGLMIVLFYDSAGIEFLTLIAVFLNLPRNRNGFLLKSENGTIPFLKRKNYGYFHSFWLIKVNKGTVQLVNYRFSIWKSLCRWCRLWNYQYFKTLLWTVLFVSYVETRCQNIKLEHNLLENVST